MEKAILLETYQKNNHIELINSKIVSQYNKAIQDRSTADELAKRCLGAIEVLQGLIGEEESKEEVEAEVVE